MFLNIYLHAHSNGRNSVHLALDPGSDLIRLVGKLATEGLIVLLFPQLVLKGLITLWHKGLDLAPLGLDVLKKVVK